ncbi:bis(5'-nucleosyl)-tetraphosphatase (symmetrical) YqeK [Clostridium sp.]|jgi:predicted HD superfamily hydrolase involved in NAD metabolism|uniref:bis(5'-nucleosyl)-tetraphosphatase (symmetrical) YqeK n=1 Tax=Clostridium sp. TaxID=1506 RepID=UPI002589DDE8|nr:bis(5'-nucleosyl)-tetraphosphatase (symmetrical) YqeK [Clostridium sp.]MDF2504397.1 hypothetical protein [Clostridium sp.]
MWNEAKMEEYLKKNLKEARLNHSFGVRDTAEMLAKKYGEDSYKARIAGLIHDCAKQMDKNKILDICTENGYKLDYIVSKNPGIMHGAVGAIIAKKVMEVEDEDILNAIEYHTTGRKNMSLLEKIVYLADYIEPSRDFPGVDKLRETVNKGLNKGLLLSFNSTIELIISRGDLIHLNTIEARNYIICNEK